MALPTPQSYADLLALFDRVFPPGYLRPMRDGDGPGYEFYRAVAAVGERISAAVDNTYGGAFITTATGGSFASGSVTLTRATTGGGAITVKAASIIRSNTTGARFRLDEDVVFGAGDTTGTGADSGSTSIGVTALAESYRANVPGTVTAANGDVLADDLPEFDKLVLDPPWAAGLDAPAPDGLSAGTAGGAFPWLDALGSNRGLVRIAGETDADFRSRLRSLLDTVTPAAVDRVLSALLSPVGVSHRVVETFNLDYQTVWDGPDTNIPNVFSTLGAGSYRANTFAYDDDSTLRPPDPGFNRWLDEADQVGALVVVVDPIAARRDVGLAYDDTATTQTALQTGLGGERATNAWDVPDVAPGVSLQGAFDGFDLEKAGIYKGINDVLAAIVPAGCNHYVEALGQ